VTDPAWISRQPVVRIKTDCGDAVERVGLYRAAGLTDVRVPTPAEEERRVLALHKHIHYAGEIPAAQRYERVILVAAAH